MHKSLARAVLPMIVLLIPFLYLTIAVPFGEPVQTILEVIYLCVLLAITVWESRENTDEVRIAAARFIASTATYVGIVCTVGFLIVMTRFPTVAAYIASVADTSANHLPPAAAGFGLGAIAVIAVILVCGIITGAAWFWRASRP